MVRRLLLLLSKSEGEEEGGGDDGVGGDVADLGILGDCDCGGEEDC